MQKAVSKGCRRSSAAACGPALKIFATISEVVFLEIFSGTGRLGKAVSRELSIPVLLWDITIGDEYDLRNFSNRQKIVGWMRARRIAGGHLGTPCQSFSRARDNPPGPPPLCSNEHVLIRASRA